MPSDTGTESTVINILQITDCHLTKEADGDLLGVNTRESLDAVMQVILARNEQPDHILATGDLAQDASTEAYTYFKSIISTFACESSWLPGNHDQRKPMQQVIGSGKELDKVVRIGRWQIVMLDSLVEGAVHGRLESAELTLLEQALNDSPDLHTLVCLHHHPISIDSVWLDNIGLKNADELLALVERYDNVKAILWGHIHQHLDAEYKGIKLMATPSTCIQFLPKSTGFAVDDIAPGYRWLRLHADGSVESDVVRADAYEFELDMQSNGY